MYYVTFSVPDGSMYTAKVKARTARYAIHLVIRGKRQLVDVRLTPPDNVLFYSLGQYA